MTRMREEWRERERNARMREDWEGLRDWELERNREREKDKSVNETRKNPINRGYERGC